jgi:tripartite-type tricarboxylate transporter receptor subunit TctC
MLCAAIVAAIAAPAAAQDYPVRPIRIIVAYTPAGATDILARAVGQKMSENWGQPVIVDNRPGAAGNIGTEIAAKSAPDGYTLLMATAGTHGINPGLYRKLNWDPKEFIGVSLVAMVPNILVVNNALPVKSVKELIAYAKANPGKLSYGSPGLGSTAHLSMELFKSMTGTNMIHVPYKGSAGVMADVISGQIALTMDNIPPYLPQVKAGKLRALAVSPSKRTPAAPEIPTVAEAGVPGYDSGAWFGLVAPAGTPKPILDALNFAVVEALKDPATQKSLQDLGVDVVGDSAKEFEAYIKLEIPKWTAVVKNSGAHVD